MHNDRPATRWSPLVLRLDAIGRRLCQRGQRLSTGDAARRTIRARASCMAMRSRARAQESAAEALREDLAAVGVERLTGHRRRQIGGQEHDRTGHVLVARDAPQGHAGVELVDDHLGLDAADL